MADESHYGEYRRRKKRLEADAETLMAYLTVGNAVDPQTGERKLVPWAWTELQMCRLYGCTPSQLAKEDRETVLTHIRFLQVENEVQEFKNS